VVVRGVAANRHTNRQISSAIVTLPWSSRVPIPWLSNGILLRSSPAVSFGRRVQRDWASPLLPGIALAGNRIQLAFLSEEHGSGFAIQADSFSTTPIGISRIVSSERAGRRERDQILRAEFWRPTTHNSEREPWRKARDRGLSWPAPSRNHTHPAADFALAQNGEPMFDGVNFRRERMRPNSDSAAAEAERRLPFDDVVDLLKLESYGNCL